jgi:glycosyltransferase involved in cell wall biosynthesis
MKRVLVCNLTPRGGMLHYASQFCNELSLRQDIILKVAIASYHKNTLYHQNISFIKIRSNPDLKNFMFDSLNIFYHIYFLSQVVFFRPQIVHFMDNHPWYIPYVYICKLFGVEVFTTQHDPTLHSGEAKTLTGKIAGYTNAVLRKKSDTLIVHGDMLKQEVIKKYHIPAERIVSIPHGAYTFFNQYAQGLVVQKNTFLFFGRILDYK